MTWHSLPCIYHTRFCRARGLLTVLSETPTFPGFISHLILNQALESALLHLNQSHGHRSNLILFCPPSAGDTLPGSLITALFEVLSFPDLMDDVRVNESLESALLHLKQSHELALTDGGRYQGLYRLMAHPGPQIRAMVGACSMLYPLS